MGKLGKFFEIDNLAYQYDPSNPNRLLGVKDFTANEAGFRDDDAHSQNDYTYDADGNMTADNNKGISAITYNHMNLPTHIHLENGDIYFTYDALGNKWDKFVDGDEGEKGTAYRFGFQYDFDYLGDVIYNEKLMFFPTGQGYVSTIYS